MTYPISTPLRRAILAAFRAFEGVVEVELLGSRPWASITFSGQRHRFGLRIEGHGAGRAADAYARDLPDREFDLAEAFVADIVLLSDERDGTGDSAYLVVEALIVDSS